MYVSLHRLICLALVLIPFNVTPAAAQEAALQKDRSPGESASKKQDENEEFIQLREEIRGLREAFRRNAESGESRLLRIEKEIERLGSEAQGEPRPQQPAARPQESTRISPSTSSGKTAGGIFVCYKGCDFNDLQSAVDASQPGGIVTVAPEINGTCAVINKSLRLVGLKKPHGARARLVGGVCGGKAPLVTTAANVEIVGFEISGVAVSDANGACIRLDSGSRDVSIRDLYCHDSQNGILGSIDGRLLIEDSVFERNGFNNGRAHGIYVAQGDEVLIRRSKILSSKDAGHSLKSGVRKLVVEDSIIAALDGHNSRALDAFAGGDIELRRNVIQQGPESDNSDVIGLALEPNRFLPEGHTFLMEDNLVVYDNENRRKVLFRGEKLGPVVLRNNTLVGIDAIGMNGVQEEGDRWLKSRKDAGLPRYDGTLSSLPQPGKSR